jgi:hypothetical protein
VDEAKIAALVNKLCDEFKADLRDLRSDLDACCDDVADLTDRVAYLEEQAKGPKVFGWIDYRMSLVGDDINLDNDTDNLTAMLGVQGRITDSLSGRIAVKVRDTYSPVDFERRAFTPVGATLAVTPIDPRVDFTDGGTNPFNRRPAEQLWLDEAVLVANSTVLIPATWSVGRQFQSYAMGLLVDNERQSQQGVRVQVNDVLNSNIDLDVFGGGVATGLSALPNFGDDQYNFPGVPGPAGAVDNDGYLSARASFSRPSWAVGFNWLQDGVHKEQGWSADLAAQIWGRDVRVEVAQLLNDVWGFEPSNEDMAIMASADIWRGNNWRLTGFFSDVEENYESIYSILHPYYEIVDRTIVFGDDFSIPGGAVPWEKWLRNPLAEAGYRIIGGHLDFMLANVPFTVAFFDRDAQGTAPVELFDQLWAVGASKQIADGITANVTYAREDSAIAGLSDRQLLQGSVTVGF